MRNKIKTLLMVFALAFGFSVGIVGCSGECNHTYTDEVIAPTCVEGGHTLHTCTECGDSFSDAQTDALGHDYQESVVAPKCVEKGYTLHACSRCDDSYKDTETAAIGHNFAEELSYDNNGHYHECTRCDEHDTLVKHVYDETDYKFSMNGHYTVCECGAKSAEQSHVFDREIKDADTLKNEATCEDAKTYFKSCVCGFISTSATFTEGEPLGHNLGHNPAVAGTETTKSSIEYYECEECGKFYADEDATTQITESEIYSDKIGRLLNISDKVEQYSDNNFVQNDDGSMSYTKAASAPADESAKMWFGEQDGNDVAVWEFDLRVVAANAGELTLIFRAWDDSNLYRLNLCNPAGNGRIELVKRKWVGSAAQTVNKTGINGITVNDNVDNHVAIMCLGYDKVVMINGEIVYRVEDSDFTVGYFGIEGKAMNSIVIKNAYLRKYTGTDINEKRAALEADYPSFWDELSEGITNACAHEYKDNVVPPTCKDDGYTEHTCKYCDDYYTDATVPSTGAHLFNEFANNGATHIATCTACGTEAEQAHSFTEEEQNEDALKIAENHEHGATYYKSCVCGAVSQNDTDTFTVPQVYKYLKDAVQGGNLTTNITQAADGSLTYTKGSASENANVTFGLQSGNECQYVEFDLEFVAGDWGFFELQFGVWDENSNIAIERPTKNGGEGLTAKRTDWIDGGGRTPIDVWDIGGFTFNDNTVYHVVIMCCGWQKTVMVNNQVIFSASFSANSEGYFRFYSWDLQSLTISNIIVKNDYADNDTFAAEHPELWQGLGSGITNTKRT